MCLLSDRELFERVHGEPPMIQDLPSMDWREKSSPIQPASIDLHVGRIFVPTAKSHNDEPFTPKRGHVLEPGETAVVTTAEILNLPPEIGAFGFPPTSISAMAVLMTNPGHVDPGFKGRMRFTLINMGRSSFSIAEGKEIVTLLFLRMSAKPEADYSERIRLAPGQLHADDPSLDTLARLGKDFLDFRRQAEVIAEGVVRKTEVDLKRWDTELANTKSRWGLIVAVVGIAAAIVPTVAALLWQLFGPVADLQGKVATIAGQLDVSGMNAAIDSLRSAVDSVMQAISPD